MQQSSLGIDFTTSGNLVLDDVELESGVMTKNVLGGAGSYSKTLINEQRFRSFLIDRYYWGTFICSLPSFKLLRMDAELGTGCPKQYPVYSGILGSLTI
jgi:hypothetical protein